MEIELPPPLEDIEHERILNFGQPFALGLLWDNLKLGETLERLLTNPSFVAPVKSMVFNRLIAPKSELATSQWVKGEYIGGCCRRYSPTTLLPVSEPVGQDKTPSGGKPLPPAQYPLYPGFLSSLL